MGRVRRGLDEFVDGGLWRFLKATQGVRRAAFERLIKRCARKGVEVWEPWRRDPGLFGDAALVACSDNMRHLRDTLYMPRLPMRLRRSDRGVVPDNVYLHVMQHAPRHRHLTGKVFVSLDCAQRADCMRFDVRDGLPSPLDVHPMFHQTGIGPDDTFNLQVLFPRRRDIGLQAHKSAEIPITRLDISEVRTVRDVAIDPEFTKSASSAASIRHLAGRPNSCALRPEDIADPSAPELVRRGARFLRASHTRLPREVAIGQACNPFLFKPLRSRLGIGIHDRIDPNAHSDSNPYIE